MMEKRHTIGGKTAYSNGERNIYLNDGDIIPDGYIKGGLKKPKSNQSRKFNWIAPESKELMINHLQENEGNLSKIASIYNMSAVVLKKGILKHYPEINILEYTPISKRFKKDKEFAVQICQEEANNINSIAKRIGIRYKDVHEVFQKIGVN